jgi:CHASE3 domain sensor protein
MDSDEIRQLLKEIRDTQREHLAEYRRVTERSLELQRRAVARQEQMANVYRRLLIVGGGLVAALLALLVLSAGPVVAVPLRDLSVR